MNLQAAGDTQSIFSSYETIKTADPTELVTIVVGEYMKQIPSSIDSPDDLNMIGNLLSELTNHRTYLTGIHAMLQIETKILKRDKDRKTEAEDMMMRRDIIKTAIDSLSSQYDACSRMLTARKMQMDELRMLGDGPRYGRRDG